MQVEGIYNNHQKRSLIKPIDAIKFLSIGSTPQNLANLMNRQKLFLLRSWRFSFAQLDILDK